MRTKEFKCKNCGHKFPMNVIEGETEFEDMRMRGANLCKIQCPKCKTEV